MTASTLKRGLSPRTIKTLIEAAEPGLWAHRHGLSLSISKAGSATWTFRYSASDGKRRLMTLETVTSNEPISAASLRALEHKAEGLRLKVKAGHDPLAERKAATGKPDRSQSRIETFEEAARRFIAQQSPHWKNEKHKAQWSATLEAYAYPTIGRKVPSGITTQDVLDVLRQKYKETTLWDGARETASRVRMRVETVLNAEFAINRDHPLQKDAWQNFRNPAQWKNHLQTIFKSNGKRTKTHFAAMDFKDVPIFVAELRCKADYSAKALLLTILCAVRSSETLNAEWSEINLENATWTIPAGRMKAGVEHRVPLPSAAIELLKSLHRIEGNPYVFPGAKRNRPLSNMAMIEMLRGMRDGLTVHGFRSAFRDWTAETTLHPDTIAEMALAHTIKDKTVAAYRRGDAFERRKELMQQWCDYISIVQSEYELKWRKYIA
ncbi:MAG: DUF4102 domain-containing protein [Mesorhizobium sp.]|nr:MAG: DUF4102 domain-containing protein [Mesorhizobium sp.]